MTDCVSYCTTESKWTGFFKSNRSQIFYKIGVIKNFSKLTLNHLRPVCNSVKKCRCFPVNLRKFLITPFLQNTIWRLLSGFFHSFYFFFPPSELVETRFFIFLNMLNHGFRTWWISRTFGKLYFAKQNVTWNWAVFL